MTDHLTLIALYSLILGYAAGSIPFGLILTKMAGLGDIRQTGSGNIGATNVLRTGRKDIAAATLLCDALKGLLIVLLCSYLWGLQGAFGAAMGAVIGHIFPVWLKFKGGKGVATSIGVFLGLSPIVGLAVIGTWLFTAFATRFSSLAAIVAMALSPVFAYYMASPKWIYMFGTIAVLVIFKHKDNIKRLIKGTEPKIGKK